MGPNALRIEAAAAAAAAGAVAVFVSLFLTWYQPDLSAWTTFEVLDLVLAGLALATLVALGNEIGLATPVPERLLPWLGATSLVITVAALINHPPLALGHPPSTGAWLALGGSVFMVAGGIARVTRVSFAVTFERAVVGPRRHPDRPAAADAQTEPLPPE